jgi:hypothetical protein
MGTILKNILAFEALDLGAPVSLPHRLNVNGINVVPKLVGADAAGFTISADATDVTVTRTPASVGDAVNIYVEYWHTIESVTPLVPPPGHLTGQVPFILATGGGGSELQYADARVRANGDAYATHGCSTSGSGNGQYHVDFDPAFPDNVAVTALICQDPGGTIYGIYATNITNTGFDIVIRGNTDGFIGENAEWSFIALPSTTLLT